MNTPCHPLDLWIGQRLGPAPLTRALLEDWQTHRLRETLQWVKDESPYYCRRLASLSHPATVTLKDLATLPFTTAHDIRTDPLRFVCLSQSLISRVVTLDSSGTTGHPKRLFFTGEDLELTLAFFENGLRLMAAAGDTVMILLPGDKPDSVGDLLRRAVRRLGATPLLAGIAGDVIAETAEVIAGKRVDLVIGIPVQVLALARYWRNWDHANNTIGNVLLCSDNVAESVIREISSIWGCEIFQDWGMTEMGYGGGVDCPVHRGYHLQEADFLFEIVDPQTDRTMPDGETGEVVFTTLTRRGMPLIRYRTGDLSRFIMEPCACGSILRKLDRIETRKTGQISLGQGEISMADLDEVLFSDPDIADFTADLVQEASLRILKIKASINTFDGVPHPSHQVAILALLDRLPAVSAALERGELRIDVAVTGDAIPFTRQKRQIRQEQGP